MKASLTLELAQGSWTLAQPFTKLLARGQLPGAFGYDLAAASVRNAVGLGASRESLLPLALPTSWMVNAKAPSTVFQHWLSPELEGVWAALLGVLVPLGAPGAELSDPVGQELTRLLDALCVQGHELTALSKVLAVLVPDVVPLMDDAAVWLCTGAVAQPADADHPKASCAHAVPMLRWFLKARESLRPELEALAEVYDWAPLSAAQCLDRLLWFDSWGYRHSHGRKDYQGPRWWWVRDGKDQGVVLLEGPHPEAPAHECLGLTEQPDAAWRLSARTRLTALPEPWDDTVSEG